jgi:Arylsulfotransferase (ASST)
MRLKTKVTLWATVTCSVLVVLTLYPLLNRPKAFPGYILVAPVLSTETHLMDMQGRDVHAWQSTYTAGEVACLLENGHLLRACQLSPDERLFGCPQAGGRVQEFTWDGDLVWDFKYHNEKQIPHHDLLKLPNGNVLLIVWEIKTAEETIAAGRGRESVDGPWLVDSIIEIKPTGKETGEVVWEWHVWDHLIQDLDSSQSHYGDVSAHPELIDVNFGETLLSEVSRARSSPELEAKRKTQLNTLRGIGYLGTPSARGNSKIMPDWTHVNAVDYDAGLDQVMLTVRAFSEFWIIDHGTTTAEARGHAGGRSGRGGDLLYRWGNPRAYRAGKEKDQRLFSPHDAHWIPRGRPGAGHVLVFNNGVRRPGTDYSSVDEIVLPMDIAGGYDRKPGSAYAPDKPVWSFKAPIASEFFAPLLSSAQRLPNGNTMICDGVGGTLFEVASDHKVVWKQKSPTIVAPGSGGLGPANGAAGTESRPHEILSSLQRDALKMSSEQKKDLDDFQNELDAKLEKTLTDEQRKRLRETIGFGGFAVPGEIMSLSRQVLLKPTDEQKKTLVELQDRVDAKLGKIFTADQKIQFERMKQDFGRVGFSGSPSASKLAAPIASPPPGVNPVFRAIRYSADYPGLAGRDLRPIEKGSGARPAKSAP